jgi:DNA-binding winged helix-turn-helix (wHTH) protein
MRETQASGSAYRFGTFELDPRAGELRKHGVRIKLQDQPLQVLLLLLEHPGDAVTREEIQNRLWPPGTHVDYDNAINSAMRKLRDALSDTSESPRFIETLARRGYRFVGHIETPWTEKPLEPPIAIERIATKTVADSKRKTRLVRLAVAAFLVLAAAIAWSLLRPHAARESIQLRPVPLTAATGWEDGPSFSPDGNQVAYSWSGSENLRSNDWHIYVKSIGSGKPLQLTAAARPDVFPDWSPDGRVIAFRRFLDPTTGIYLIPPLGGAERRVAEFFFVSRTSWSPDGRFIAVGAGAAFDSSSLYLLDVENGNKVRLTTPPDAKTGDRDPVFSLGWPFTALHAMWRRVSMRAVSAGPCCGLPPGGRAQTTGGQQRLHTWSGMDSRWEGRCLLSLWRWHYYLSLNEGPG